MLDHPNNLEVSGSITTIFNNGINFPYFIIELTNHTDEDLYILSHNTPFEENYIGNAVISSNDNLLYLKFGYNYKRSISITESDIITVKKKSSVSKRVLLSDYFDFKSKGIYNFSIRIENIYYSSNIIDIINNSCNYSNNRNGASSSLILSGELTINQIINRTHYFQINTENDEAKQLLINELTNEICTILNKMTISYDDLFIKWFGARIENVDIVKKNFNALVHSIKNENIKYLFERNNHMLSYYAMASSDDIVFYPKYFNTQRYGFDSQIGILVHEYMHICFDAKDIENNIDCSIKLAYSYPEKAIEAANNYEYYFEEYLSK